MLKAKGTLAKLRRHPSPTKRTSSPPRIHKFNPRHFDKQQFVDMPLKVSILYTIVIFALFFCHGQAEDFHHPAVFNFGDSNSDTGGLVAGIAFPLGPPNGQTYFRKFTGRFCDGRLIIDFLVNSSGFSFLNPYLDSVGARSFQTGCNFAGGGCTILPANAASICPFSFGIQVSQFLRFKARVFELLDKDTKLNKFLPQKDYLVQGLYIIDIGQNDLDAAFGSKSEDQAVGFIPTILSELEAGIKKLYYTGARKFWIHNTGPLGCLPRIIAIFGNDPSKLDELGCVKSHNEGAKAFNLQLQAFCKRFQEEFSDVGVTYVDIFKIKSNLISNYSQYGFKQPIAACCGYGGLPLNFDRRIPCGVTKIFNGTSMTAKPCENTAEYVNWDGSHYTEAANFHVASQILTGKYSNPPISNKSGFTLELRL